jgi:hypothetical protein
MYLRGCCYVKQDAIHAHDALVEIWKRKTVIVIIGMGFFVMRYIFGSPGVEPSQKIMICGMIEVVLLGVCAFAAHMTSVFIKRKDHVAAQTWLSPFFITVGAVLTIGILSFPAAGWIYAGVLM